MTIISKVLVLSSVLAFASAGCPNDCSGHGSCNVYSACECYRNWMGADCSERVCYFGLAFVDTPSGDLNSDGFVSLKKPIESRYSNSYEHEIYPWYAGWGGTHYEVYQTGRDTSTAGTADDDKTAGFVSQFVTTTGNARGEAHFYKECSNKGTCNRATGQCECFPGFSGEGCSRTACPNSCSGHGTCKRLVDSSNGSYVAWDAYATQECHCDPGYFGADCSLRSCPKGDDPVTKYEGFTRIRFQSPTSSTDNTYYNNNECPQTQWSDSNYPAKQNVPDEESGMGPSAIGELPSVDYQKRIWSHDMMATFQRTCLDNSNNKLCMGWNPWYCQLSHSVGHLSGQTAGGYCAHPVANAMGEVACVNSEFNVQTGNDANYYSGVTGVLSSALYKATESTNDDPTNFTASSGPVTMTASNEKLGETSGTATKFRADLCAHSNAPADVGCTGTGCGTALCQQSPISYRAGVRNANDLMDSAAISTHKMVVTGTHSSATGRLTKGGCTDRNCPDLDFWSMYLKDVSGEFQKGDAIRIDGTDSEGRRTFGFELCNYIAEISTFYSSSHQDNVQQDETQMLEISFPGFSDHRNTGETGVGLDGYIALEFEDELGDTWMTEGIRVTAYKTATACATAETTLAGAFNLSNCDGNAGHPEADNLATAIQDALEALPNNVIPDVQVEYEHDFSSVDHVVEERRVFSISFVSNSGNIPKMNVSYNFRNTRGSTPEKWMSTNASCQDGDYKTCLPYFGQASSTQTSKMSDLLMSSGLPASSAQIIDMDWQGTVEHVHLDGGSTPTLVSKGAEGSTESVECSNRGICDHATGLCKCFTGFTNEDCSQQNSLAMG